MMIYKDYKIYPSTAASGMWEFVHKDYDGHEDNRCGSGISIEECKESIDLIEDK
jgi:hypothetical protein